MIDFHTHILHRMDDGSSSVEMSVQMLESIYKSGTDAVVLSSHYYPRDEKKLDEFLEKRDRHYEELKKACEGHTVPYMRLAAEVNMHSDFSKFERLKELCIEDTNYMLVEMPMSKWEDWMYECLHSLKVKGIKPIMAHIDRYLHFSKEELNALDEIKPLYQVNAESFASFKKRKKLLELFYEDKLHVIGSDMHDMEKRKNTLPDAYIKLESKFGEAFISTVENNGDAILADKPVERNVNFPFIKKTKLMF